MCPSAIILLALSGTTFANIIVDTKDVNTEKYHADMYECEQLLKQVDHNQTASLGKSVVGSTAKGAAIGAAGAAIGGGSGSNGAKVGAGIGLISGALKHGSAKRQAEQAYNDQEHIVMRNCMVGRGYSVLN